MSCLHGNRVNTTCCRSCWVRLYFTSHNVITYKKTIYQWSSITYGLNLNWLTIWDHYMLQICSIISEQSQYVFCVLQLYTNLLTFGPKTQGNKFLQNISATSRRCYVEVFYLFWLPRHFLRLDSGFVDYILVLVTLNHQDIKAYNHINKTHYGLLHKWSQNWNILEREYFTPLNCKCVSGVLLFPLSNFWEVLYRHTICLC